jgi:hypothetical protein
MEETKFHTHTKHAIPTLFYIWSITILDREWGKKKILVPTVVIII